MSIENGPGVSLGQRPYASLASKLNARVRGATKIDGLVLLPCPVCQREGRNGQASIYGDAGPMGDAIECDHGCGPAAVERELRALVGDPSTWVGNAQMPYLKLAFQVLERVEGAQAAMADMVDFPCPVCNGKANMAMTANELGDVFACYSDCDPADIEQGVRYLVEKLPVKCEDPSLNTSYSHSRTCMRCQRYAKALAEATTELQRTFGTADIEDEDGSGWLPTSLLDAEPPSVATVLKVGDRYLLHRGKVTLVHGMRGSGKTPFSYIPVVEQVKAGNLGLIIDYEMGASDAKALLNDLGLSDQEIADYVIYVDAPPSANAKGRRELGDYIRQRVEKTGRELSVAVTDSLTESMATVPGADDNKVTDVTVWFKSLPDWLAREFNCASIVIDHSGVVDGERPSGSHKKREAPQQHFWVQNRSPFSRTDETGRSDIKVMKDRPGKMKPGTTVAELHTRLGGSFYLTEMPARGASAPGTTGPTTFTMPLDLQPSGSTDDDVLADIRTRPGISRTDVTGGGAAGVYRRAALDRLVADGKVRQQKIARTKHYWAV
jgi:hypothetical protein